MTIGLVGLAYVLVLALLAATLLLARDRIGLRPVLGSQESNAVYIACHDGGDTEQLAPDVGTLVSGLHSERKDA
jgi:hypothetical protein